VYLLTFFRVLSESWRVVHTDYRYALVYVCRRSSADAEFCIYETMLVLVRPGLMRFNSDELEEYFQLTLSPQCLTAATQLEFVTHTGNLLLLL